MTVGITSALPLDDDSLLLGNDIAGERVIFNPQPTVSCIPETRIETEKIKDEFPNIFPACVVTRSMSKNDKSKHGASISDNCDISETFMNDLDSNCDLSSSNDDETVTQLNLRSNIIDRESLIFWTRTCFRINAFVNSCCLWRRSPKTPYLLLFEIWSSVA